MEQKTYLVIAHLDDDTHVSGKDWTGEEITNVMELIGPIATGCARFGRNNHIAIPLYRIQYLEIQEQE